MVGSFQAAVLLPVNVCWQTGAMFGGILELRFTFGPVTGPEQGLAPNLVEWTERMRVRRYKHKQ
jgi:hypothetical protein